MSRITKVQVKKALREVVAEYGEDHTAECAYVTDGVPECIVGVAVNKLTPELDLHSLHGSLAYQIKVHGTGNAIRPLEAFYTDAAIKVLAVAQDVQDHAGCFTNLFGDRTWGRALLEAEKF